MLVRGARCALGGRDLTLRRDQAIAVVFADVHVELADRQDTTADVGQIGRGLHPAILEDRGIDAALSAIVSGAPIPISVHVDPDLDLSQDLTFEPLMEVPAYVMLAHDHKFANKESITPEELADEPMVLLDLPFSREYFLSAFHQRGVQPRIAERTGDIAVMRSMVANGFGYGIANMRPLNTLAPDGKPMAFVPLEGNLRPLVLGAALPQAEHRTQTIQAFIDHCRSFVVEQGVFGTERAAKTDRKVKPIAAKAPSDAATDSPASRRNAATAR